MTIKGTAEVTLIRENPDGSADYRFNFPQEALDALTRLGILTALKAGIEEGDQLNPQEPVKHEWVGLTTEEADEFAMDGDGWFSNWLLETVWAIEAKLKEKNT